MTVQRINPTARPSKKTKGKLTTLSNDAFYLVSLALLLKKETGLSSLSQYIFPGGLSPNKDKTAA